MESAVDQTIRQLESAVDQTNWLAIPMKKSSFLLNKLQLPSSFFIFSKLQLDQPSDQQTD